MSTYYVSTSGGLGAGSIGDPWSLSHALSGAGGVIQPGDTIYLRGGSYSATSGFTASVSGTRTSRITFAAYLSEIPRLDGAIAAYASVGNNAWELYDGPTNTYRTVSSSMGGTQYFGHISISGTWYPLVTHKTVTGLMAATQDYRSDGEYYMGPGIIEDATGGYVYIRLEDANPTPMSGRVVTYVSNKDPRQNDIRLFTTNTGLTVNGNYLTFDGITIDDYYIRTLINGTGATLANCGGRFGLFGVNLNSSRGATLDNVTIDGLLYHDLLWLAWYDVKGGITNADGCRKCGVDAGDASDWKIINSDIVNVFDGFLGGATNRVEITNCFIQCWDDAWQIYATAYNLHIHHNTVYGAGFGHDSSGSNNINSAPGTIYIHHNTIDPAKYPILWGRVGVSGSGEGILGVKDPSAIGTHGSPTTGRWPSPWKYFYNTVVYGNDIGSYGNVNFFGGETAEFQYGPSVTHDLFNNILILPGSLGRDFSSNSKQERMDGNVIYNPEGPASTPIYRYIHTSTGLLDGESPIGSLNTLAKMRASQAFTDSQTYYPPGWEASGLDINPQLNSSYVPQNALVLTGAIDLSGMGWPGTETYQPERGAVGNPQAAGRTGKRRIRHRYQF